MMRPLVFFWGYKAVRIFPFNLVHMPKTAYLTLPKRPDDVAEREQGLVNCTPLQRSGS